MSSRNHRKVVDQVAAAGILQHAIDMQKARGADVGSRVTAPSPSVDLGVSEVDQSVPATPGDTDRSSDNGRQQ
jgi:putative Holliday junction resolvase